MKKPVFSILHTSARPEQWRTVYEHWMQMAERPQDLEYVLCIDPRWGFSLDPAIYQTELDNVVVVQNTGRRCYVDGVNLAARAASGSIFIVNADDQFACYAWDRLLSGGAAGVSAARSFVIEVTTGTPNEHEKGVMVMPILSRARYEQQGGFVFYPEYESMFADNDFCESARKDGVVIDARHLHFPHRHAMFDGKGGWHSDWATRADEALRAQNRMEAYEVGRLVYAKRKASGFAPQPRRRSIALCLPGEKFEGAYLDAILDLQAHLLVNLDMDVMRLRAYTSNPYVTREDLRRAIEKLDPQPEMVLWIDDDNPLSVAHFETLLAGLDAHPEVDGISGWCWIHDENKRGFTVSCGNWAPDHLHWEPFHPSFVYKRELQAFETGGFPCILMRMSALEKAGDGAFLPIVDSRLPHGISGEDLAFFLHAEQGGAKFLVDPKVRVPHLKYVEVEPVVPEDGKPRVKVACMIRAKNEGRWIRRTIESVKELCGENIFLMEDGSVDDTREQAEAAGATVLPSPFVGLRLDESRDKDWLLQEVIARCNPDWILMPDGDEELQPGGCERIRRAVEKNPDCDCFALKFLYFWDRVDQIRIDGVYGTMSRQSLFRANTNFRFRSYYAESDTPNQNHVGLHTSNAPGLGGRVMSLNVALLHYGYLHKEDRIRKYRWMMTIDPHNEGEGYYLHCVQGDLPEVPGDMKLKHGGPLEFAKLPARMVPVFENGVPGPWVDRVAEPLILTQG